MKFKKNVAAQEKLCEHAKYLAQYLNIDINPYDFEYMLEKYAEGDHT